MGWSTAITSAADAIPATPVTQSRTFVTTAEAAKVPRSRARCMAS
jgi:hypothetical protein